MNDDFLTYTTKIIYDEETRADLKIQYSIIETDNFNADGFRRIDTAKYEDRIFKVVFHCENNDPMKMGAWLGFFSTHKLARASIRYYMGETK